MSTTVGTTASIQYSREIKLKGITSLVDLLCRRAQVCDPQLYNPQPGYTFLQNGDWQDGAIPQVTMF